MVNSYKFILLFSYAKAVWNSGVILTFRIPVLWSIEYEDLFKKSFCVPHLISEIGQVKLGHLEFMQK